MTGCDIAFIGTFPTVLRGSRAGSETVAEALAAAGHRVRLVSRAGRPHQRVVRTLSFAATGRFQLAVLDVYSTRVLHLTAAVARILASRGIPYIAVLHGGALLERYDRIAPRLRRVLDHAVRVVSPSRYLQRGFAERDLAVQYIPNALRLEYFPYRERAAPAAPLRLLWVRAFGELYRPLLAVDAVAALRDRGVPATLTMVGPDRGLLPATRARARELGVAAAVTFTGPIPNPDLRGYYHEHDFLLNTTQYESFGLAVAEAAATGLPTVSAAVGELAHAWRDDHDVLLVDGADGAAFADRLVRALADEGCYRRISITARERVQQYALPRIVGEWQELITDAVR